MQCVLNVSGPQCVRTVILYKNAFKGSSEASIQLQQSELAISKGYLPHLQSFQHQISSLCFPFELQWKCSNKKRDFGTKMTVKDI